MPKILKKVTFAGTEKWLSGKFLHRDKSELVIILAILVYTVVFSYFTIQKFHAFSTYAWDLGIFDQSFWTTAHSGKLFFSTVEQFIIPSGSFFGTHFSPVLFLVLPFYYVASSPQTLLVAQSFILALGAVPLYFFAKNVLNNKTMAVVFSLVYLIYPPLQGVNWFDFHAQAFLPVFFFSAFYFLYKEKWFPYFLFIFLSLSVAENVPITVAFIGFYCFWRFRKSIVEAVKTRALTEPKLIVPVGTIVIAMLWLYLVGYRHVYYPFNPIYTQLYKAVDNWSVLGTQNGVNQLGDPNQLPLYIVTRLQQHPGDPNQLPLYILTHLQHYPLLPQYLSPILPSPGLAVSAFLTDFPLKFLYLMLLFGPIIFLSVRSSIAAISLAWLVPAFFSNYPPYYTIGDHFPAYITAFLFMAAVEGVRKNSKPFRLPNIGSYGKLLLLGSVLFALVVSPLSPAMAALGDKAPALPVYHVQIPTRHDQIEQQIVDLVPANASILTINNIFPHFSSRLNAYAYPLDWMVKTWGGNRTALENYTEELYSKSTYVMTDNPTDENMTGRILAGQILVYNQTEIVGINQFDNRFGTYTWFGTRAFCNDSTIYLFEKDYRGPAKIFNP